MLPVGMPGRDHDKGLRIRRLIAEAEVEAPAEEAVEAPVAKVEILEVGCTYLALETPEDANLAKISWTPVPVSPPLPPVRPSPT